jgi:hypothetical protein
MSTRNFSRLTPWPSSTSSPALDWAMALAASCRIVLSPRPLTVTGLAIVLPLPSEIGVVVARERRISPPLATAS